MKQLTTLLFVALLFGACSREEFPTNTPPTIAFELEGTLDGQPWLHQVGLDGTYLETDAFEQWDHVVFESLISDTDCADCDPVFWMRIDGANGQDAGDVIGTETPFDLNALSGNNWIGDFTDVFDETFDVNLNGEDIDQAVVSLTLDPLGETLEYTVFGIDQQGHEFDWSAESFALADCWIEEITLPGISLEVGDTTFSIELNNVDWEGEVFIFSDHPAYTGTFATNEDMVFPLDADFTPPTFFTFLITDELTGFPLTFLLELGGPELADLHVPSAFLYNDIGSAETSIVLGLTYQGEPYMTAWPCEDWLPEQPEWAHFELTAVEDYVANAAGQATQKITFDTHVVLHPIYGFGDPLELELNGATVAVALPD